MFARIPSALLSRWGRACLALSLVALPVLPSCTQSEDTEPFIPASPGAQQPSAKGSLMSETDACAELLKAANDAYKNLGCDNPPQYPKCPGFLRPAGGSGCYQYYADSVTACVKAYGDADSCQSLTPCFPTAEEDLTLATCEMTGEGGSGGGAAGGASGGASASAAGATAAGASAGGASGATGGAATGGAP